MTDQLQRFCVNCRFYAVQGVQSVCTHERAKRTDLVTGALRSTICDVMRYSDERCGVAARLFEPKETHV